MNAILTAALAKLVARVELDPGEIEAALSEILSGRASDVQAAGFAVAMRTKGETAHELAAMVRTMLSFSTSVTAPEGAIDTCGTGGDRAGTINVSTLAALVAAGAGAKVVKHGNRAASSKCGSADVLEALGVPIELGPAGVERCVAAAGVGFCFAPRYHPALRFLGPARRELGVVTTFNFLGPLANPARVRRQAVGIAEPAMAERVLAVLAENGAQHALVFYGDDGLDELTTTAGSTVHEFVRGESRAYRVDPESVGLGRVGAEAIAGGDAPANAAIVRDVLAGNPGPARDIAVLNAAAALVVADLAGDLAEGVATAQAVIDDGRAADVLATLVVVAAEAKGDEDDAA